MVRRYRKVVLVVLAVLVGLLIAHAGAAADGPGLPRPDWWELISGVIGAIIGWLSRWLQEATRRRPPGGGLQLPDDRGR